MNDAPVNNVPASASVNEDTALNFNAGNTISITDPDSGGGSLQVQFSVTNGTLTMTTLTGLSFSLGDGTADAAMTFTGTLTNVNNALATLRFDPTPNFPGAAASGIAVFSMTTSDQGNTGTGGTLTDTDSFNITVNQVNDPPTAGADSFDTIGNTELRVDIAAPSTPTVTETTGTSNGVLANDSDAVENNPFTVTSIVGCAGVVTPFDCTGVREFDVAGDYIFVHNSGALNSTITLEANQHLLGEGVGLSINRNLKPFSSMPSPAAAWIPSRAARQSSVRPLTPSATPV